MSRLCVSTTEGVGLDISEATHDLLRVADATPPCGEHGVFKGGDPEVLNQGNVAKKWVTVTLSLNHYK
jgi:hypothetical protein